MSFLDFGRPVSNIHQPFYKLYHYRDDIFRLVFFYKKEKGWEETSKQDDKEEKNKTAKEEVERISFSRVKKEIREYALCNNFNYFVTLTVNSKHCDRFSLQECQDNLRRLIHNYSRQFKYKNKDSKFHYLLITEKHKNGAFHFHGFFSDLIEGDLYTNKNGFYSSHYFDEHLGFCSFSLVRDSIKCANYICKYITEECVKNENNRIYFCSKGLARAEVHDLPARAVKANCKLSEDFWAFSNDYCRLKDFRFSELSNEEKLWLFDNYN